MAWCQCRICDEEFKSDYGFNKHRVGTYIPFKRKCLTRRQMKAKGMIIKEGKWVTGERPQRVFER